MTCCYKNWPRECCRNEPIQPSLILASFFRGQRKSFDWNHKASALKNLVWLLVNNIDIGGARAWERAQFSQAGYSCDSNMLVIRTGSCHVTRLWMLFLSMILTGLAGLLPSHFLCLVQQFAISLGGIEEHPSAQWIVKDNLFGRRGWSQQDVQKNPKQ